MPSINISESNSMYRVEMAAPGVKKEDIQIDVDGNTMTIYSETSSESPGSPEEKNKDQNYSRREYNYSSFSRSFTLPENADGDNIKAKYENGVLCVEIPKLDDGENKQKQKIKIE